jgi:hypothetical protein
MHQIQIQVIQLQVTQRSLDCASNWFGIVKCVP